MADVAPSDVGSSVTSSRAVAHLPAEEPSAASHPGLLAARAQAERDTELRARFAAPTQGSTDDESRPSPTPQDADAEPAAEEPMTVREHAAAVLASLPGGENIEIAWNHPDIGNHLGGVRLDKPRVMMLNSHRFKAQPERVESTVKHEIAHYYQGALIEKSASKGDWWSGYWKVDAALKPVFGAKWMELSADCVAIELGADWTHYTADCSGKAKKRAVAALVEGRLS